jgi:DNA-binding MarR family transcriptional regulator
MGGKEKVQPTGNLLHDLFREVFALHAALSGIMDRVHEKAGLSTAQHKIMHALDHRGQATVPDLAAHLGVSRQFVQKVCNDLLSRGFLVFGENPRHKRSKLASLTQQGRMAFRNSRQRENIIIEQALPGIDSDRVSDAKELLAHITQTVRGFSP